MDDVTADEFEAAVAAAGEEEIPQPRRLLNPWPLPRWTWDRGANGWATEGLRVPEEILFGDPPPDLVPGVALRGTSDPVWWWIAAIPHYELPPIARLLVFVLARYMGQDGTSSLGTGWDGPLGTIASTAALARWAGCTRGTVRRHLAVLEDGDWIRRVRIVREHGGTGPWLFIPGVPDGLWWDGEEDRWVREDTGPGGEA